ncbi:hypothetical protein BDP55DRAFT_635103 [Colletotrichum godetiae]|uniref:AB hydrolase-1 domain-containing protein n=1 Tax=Colletotrichum godetiae TaxID=1209918 RepID=A0AAJ0AF32_9PEZI|nr:uncharacterized protein BDP55DRAFT_635103 [Colletotrichum godetiae]KAK1672125.1 hypothetical protein BDP55DRAFT_635103 [Colletotrichum godetiae]
MLGTEFDPPISGITPSSHHLVWEELSLVVNNVNLDISTVRHDGYNPSHPRSEYSIIAYYAPGSGASTSSDYNVFPMPFLVAVAEAVLDAHKTKRFHLVGHSMRGLTGLLLAQRNPGARTAFLADRSLTLFTVEEIDTPILEKDSGDYSHDPFVGWREFCLWEQDVPCPDGIHLKAREAIKKTKSSVMVKPKLSEGELLIRPGLTIGAVDFVCPRTAGLYDMKPLRWWQTHKMEVQFINNDYLVLDLDSTMAFENKYDDSRIPWSSTVKPIYRFYGV